MKRFVRLVGELERNRRRDAKLAALVEYFSDAPPPDAAWAAYFLSGRRLGRSVPARTLLKWSAAASGMPDWLTDASYAAVGDLAETAALLFRGDEPSERSLADVVSTSLASPISEATAVETWRSLSSDERFVWNKLASGTFRAGVTSQLVARAIAHASGIDSDAVAHRLDGPWEPTPQGFARLVDPIVADADSSRPYPSASLSDVVDVHELGAAEDWLAEWKLDGIRAQLVRRGGGAYLWSHGELVTERFPDVAKAARLLPDGTVVDGEIVANSGDRALPKASLDQRSRPGKVTKRMLEEAPARLVAFDLLEHAHEDVRGLPQMQRKELLVRILGAIPSDARARLVEAETVAFDSWTDLAEIVARSRSRRAEGVVLKRRDAAYDAPGAWRALRVTPFVVHAVLLYVERSGDGPEYTFALWRDDELVPIAKTAVGIAEADARKLDRYARFNTIEAFGPVRRVRPLHVFAVAFDAIESSPRRKAGIALRSPRIVEWLRDVPPEDASPLTRLQELLAEHEAH